jgi:hypothetical protein
MSGSLRIHEAGNVSFDKVEMTMEIQVQFDRVMASLVSHAQSLQEQAILLAQVNAKEDGVIQRLDKANGRAAEVEKTLGALNVWKSAMASEHVAVQSSMVEVKAELKDLNNWRTVLSAEHTSVLGKLAEDKADLKVQAISIAALLAWKERNSGGADWLWKVWGVVATLAALGLAAMRYLK